MEALSHLMKRDDDLGKFQMQCSRQQCATYARRIEASGHWDAQERLLSWKLYKVMVIQVHGM